MTPGWVISQKYSREIGAARLLSLFYASLRSVARRLSDQLLVRIRVMPPGHLGGQNG
jgi:hypothetical protein